MSASEQQEKINPHIPQYISKLPWYLADKDNEFQAPSLRHQRAPDLHKPSLTSKWYKRGLKKEDTTVGLKFQKGACQNCGATTHKAKDCVERPRKLNAKILKTKLAPDEYIPKEEMVGFEAKRDRWGGYGAANYQLDATEREIIAREVEKTGINANDSEDEEGAGAKALRIREDTAKYLINLDVDSAFFDPKSRSMREDPTEGMSEERRRKLQLAGKL